MKKVWSWFSEAILWLIDESTNCCSSNWDTVVEERTCVQCLLHTFYNCVSAATVWADGTLTSFVMQEQCVCTAVTPLTLTQLDDAGDDDDDEGCHLGIGEDVLHAGAPLYIGRVDECQQAWGESGVPYMFYLCMNSYSGTKSRSTYINMQQRWAWLLRTVVHTWEREAAPGSLQM